MPVLEITRGDGTLSRLATTTIISVSAYPHDEVRQVQLFAVLAADYLLTAGFEDELPDAATILVPELLKAPEAREVYRRAQVSMKSARIAADLLDIWSRAIIHHRDLKPNLTKCVDLLVKATMHPQGTRWDSKPLSIRAVWQTWSKFKTVAHLHVPGQIFTDLAQSFSVKQSAVSLDDEPGETLSDTILLEHLDMAEHVRWLAEDRGILLPGEGWACPPDLRFPPTRLVVKPLWDWQLEILRAYRPEHAADSTDLP